MKNEQAQYFNSNPFFELGQIHLSETLAKHYLDYSFNLNAVLDIHRFASWANDEETAEVLICIHARNSLISRQLIDIGTESIQLICLTSGSFKHTLVMASEEFNAGRGLFNPDELLAFNAEVSQCQNHYFR